MSETTPVQTDQQDAPEQDGLESAEHTEQDLTEVVAAELLALDGVASLHPGLFGEVATYLPGRRVAGIRLADEGAEVHVRVAWGADVHQVVDAVRRTTQQHVDGPVDVHVEDVAPPTSG